MAAANRPTSAVSRLRSFVECPICLETLNDPRILPCQHSFCLRCLQGIWASKQPNDTVHCPFCRETFAIPEQGISGIRKDHRGNEIRDICELENHNRAVVCDVHKGKPLDIICLECKVIMCSSCLIKDHYGHRVSEVCEFLHETTKQITKELENLSAYEKKINEKKTRLEKYATRSLKEIEDTEQVINKKAEELKQRIEQQRLSLVEELCIVKQKQLGEVVKEREALGNHSAEITRVRSLCNAIALSKNPIEICNAMTEFRPACDKLADDHQVQLKRPLPSTIVSLKAAEVQSQENIIGSVTAVAMRLIKKLDVHHIRGVTNLEDKLYVLHGIVLHGSAWYHSRYLISVYEDQNPFRLQAEIHIEDITIVAEDIASTCSEKSKCLYVTDSVNDCIWKITVDDRRVTRWLSHAGDPFTLSVTSDDHILKLRDGGHHSQLEIYGYNANIIRILPLSTGIQWPLHAIQKPSGQFLISHRVSSGCSGPWVISQLTNDGKILNSFYPSDQYQYRFYPCHLSLDVEKSRVVLANDTDEKGVMLLDSDSLKCAQIHLTVQEMGRYCLGHVHFDDSKTQLLVEQDDKLCVYELVEIGPY